MTIEELLAYVPACCKCPMCDCACHVAVTRHDPPPGSLRWQLGLALEMLAMWPLVLVLGAYDAWETAREKIRAMVRR